MKGRTGLRGVLSGRSNWLKGVLSERSNWLRGVLSEKVELGRE